MSVKVDTRLTNSLVKILASVLLVYVLRLSPLVHTSQKTFAVLAENATDVFCMTNTTFNVPFKYLQFYNLFGFLWLLNFIIAFSHMVLAGTFATYYWTFDKKNVPRFALGTSMWRTCR